MAMTIVETIPIILYLVFLVIMFIYAGFIMHHLISFNYPGRALVPMVVVFVAGLGVIVGLSSLFLFFN